MEGTPSSFLGGARNDVYGVVDKRSAPLTAGDVLAGRVGAPYRFALGLGLSKDRLLGGVNCCNCRRAVVLAQGRVVPVFMETAWDAIQNGV
jgi:hypothetical protein